MYYIENQNTFEECCEYALKIETTAQFIFKTFGVDILLNNQTYIPAFKRINIIIYNTITDGLHDTFKCAINVKLLDVCDIIYNKKCIMYISQEFKSNLSDKDFINKSMNYLNQKTKRVLYLEGIIDGEVVSRISHLPLENNPSAEDFNSINKTENLTLHTDNMYIDTILDDDYWFCGLVLRTTY